MPIKERWPTTISVAALLRVSEMKRLVLVMDKETKTWGLPAGGLSSYEYLIQGLLREIGEETGLAQEKLYFNRTPHIATIINEDRTQLGFVFKGAYSAQKSGQPKEWAVHGDEKVFKAKIFGIKEILPLLEAPEDRLYKFQFNFAQLMRWVVAISLESSGAPVGYLNDWLERMSKKTEGLFFHRDTVLQEYSRWKYIPWYELNEASEFLLKQPAARFNRLIGLNRN